MLVLTRRIGERIVLADSIVITVLQVRHGRVRLGIEAPSDVHILRQEVLDRQEAAATPAQTLRRGAEGSAHAESHAAR